MIAPDTLQHRPSPLGPGGRPFRGWRFLPLLLSIGSFMANAAILLSDRAPGLLGRLSARVDAGVSRAAGAAGVDLPGSAVRVPQSDFAIHVLIWGFAAVLVGLATWSWVSLVLAGGAVFATSVAVELAQRTFTDTRTIQRHDLLANGLGVLVGTCAVAAFAVAWRVFSTRRS